MTETKSGVLPGTLDLMVLKTLDTLGAPCTAKASRSASPPDGRRRSIAWLRSGMSRFPEGIRKGLGGTGCKSLRLKPDGFFLLLGA